MVAAGQLLVQDVFRLSVMVHKYPAQPLKYNSTGTKRSFNRCGSSVILVQDGCVVADFAGICTYVLRPSAPASCLVLMCDV